MRSSIHSASLAVLAAATFSLPANAQDGAAAPVPVIPSDSVVRTLKGTTGLPILDYLKESGVKLTYLGDAGGLQGYLGESPSGKLQTFYVTPDGLHVVAGVLFREGGTNITGVQITDMQNRYDAAKKAADQAAALVGDATPQNVPAPALSSNLKKVDAEEVRQGAAATPKVEMFKSARDEKRLLVDLENAAWFQVGNAGAPVLYMFVDPNCPICHATWAELRPRVLQGEIAVRVIMIAGLKGSEPKAISILSRENPAQAWYNGEGSTRGVTVAPAPAAGSAAYKDASRYLERNIRLFDRMGMNATPYLFYFDDNGVLYEHRGKPQSLDLFLQKMGKPGEQ